MKSIVAKIVNFLAKEGVTSVQSSIDDGVFYFVKKDFETETIERETFRPSFLPYLLSEWYQKYHQKTENLKKIEGGLAFMDNVPKAFRCPVCGDTNVVIRNNEDGRVFLCCLSCDAQSGTFVDLFEIEEKKVWQND